jgi:hypothetical protein
MKMLNTGVLIATVLTAGLAAEAVPAAAATHCGCPVVHHRAVRRHIAAYRRTYAPPPPAEVSYREPPPEPGYAYDYAPAPVFDEWPAYYGGPAWYGGAYYGGPHWFGGWRHGSRAWGGGHRGGHWR